MNQELQVVPNIIVFGETGVGKSSVINMLDGSEQADVSNAAKGVSTKDICYKKTMEQLTFNVFDTVGLNEGKAGTMTPRDAIERLYNLISRLDDGISLLVFVVRASRVTYATQQIYRMFHDIICNKEVPMVIVLTGLELEPDMDGWFRRNRETFDKSGMMFQGSACITAVRGMKDGQALFEHAYRHSKEKVERLIIDSHSMAPWKVPRRSWFSDVVARVADMLGLKSLIGFDNELYQLLVTCGLSEGEAKNLTNKMGRRGNKDPK